MLLPDIRVDLQLIFTNLLLDFIMRPYTKSLCDHILGIYLFLRWISEKRMEKVEEE